MTILAMSRRVILIVGGIRIEGVVPENRSRHGRVGDIDPFPDLLLQVHQPGGILAPDLES